MRQRAQAQPATSRHGIKIGGFAKNSMGWLLSVQEVWFQDGVLWAKGPVVSRPLCAETLVRGEQHPEITWKVG